MYSGFMQGGNLDITVVQYRKQGTFLACIRNG